MPHSQEERENTGKPRQKEVTVMTHVQSDPGMPHSSGDRLKDDCKWAGQLGEWRWQVLQPSSALVNI